MNPKQLGLMIHPDTGRVVIVLKKPRTTQVLKDVTADFALMQAAEILKGDGTSMENVYDATDSFGNYLEITVVTSISKEKPRVAEERSDEAAAGG